MTIETKIGKITATPNVMETIAESFEVASRHEMRCGHFFKAHQLKDSARHIYYTLGEESDIC